MSRLINAVKMKELKITDGKVQDIFLTEAKGSGNGAIVYIPKKYINCSIYVVVCK
ncbi:MAG: DUF2080 family transposase-associated protein [Candidatus Nanoarchaeia archaeon]|nr:DUF2080 family transposase-associated protein [Candidatus Nanoarchaeia archaeon]